MGTMLSSSVAFVQHMALLLKCNRRDLGEEDTKVMSNVIVIRKVWGNLYKKVRFILEMRKKFLRSLRSLNTKQEKSRGQKTMTSSLSCEQLSAAVKEPHPLGLGKT